MSDDPRVQIAREWFWSATGDEYDVDPDKVIDLLTKLEEAQQGVIPECPPHDCEFITNPEKGACDFHEQWADSLCAYCGRAQPPASGGEEWTITDFERDLAIAHADEVAEWPMPTWWDIYNAFIVDNLRARAALASEEGK